MARARSLWLLSTACLTVSVALSVFLRIGSAPDAPLLQDKAFAERAGSMCAITAAALGDAPRKSGEPQQDARHERFLADRLGEMVRRLEQIDVDPVDRAAVDAWLDDWDRFVGLGRAYAEAVAAGDDDYAARVNARAAAPKARIDAFATVNRIPCVF